MALSTTLLIQSPAITGIRCIMGEMSFDAYFTVGDVNFDLIPALLPKDLFDSDKNVHVSSIADSASLEDEIESITANMNPEDIVLFFCAEQSLQEQALAFLNYSH